MGKVINFDKFISEKKEEKITVTVYGKDYIVPGKIPAMVPIMMARAEGENSRGEASLIIMRAADILFGKDAIDEMCENGLSANELAELVQQLFTKINGKDDDEDEEEELSDEDSRVQTSGDKSSKK